MARKRKKSCVQYLLKRLPSICIVFASFYESLSIKKDRKEAKECNKKNSAYSHSVRKCFELICEKEDTKLRKTISNYHRLPLGNREEIKGCFSYFICILCAA